MKTCKECKQEKKLDEFVKDARMKDGRSNICRECKKQKSRDYRSGNKDPMEPDLIAEGALLVKKYGKDEVKRWARTLK